MSALQIRDVPEDVHQVLRSRAVAQGQSLSEYALSVLVREAGRPTLDEWYDRARALGPVDMHTSAVDILREERESRE